MTALWPCSYNQLISCFPAAWWQKMRGKKLSDTVKRKKSLFTGGVFTVWLKAFGWLMQMSLRLILTDSSSFCHYSGLEQERNRILDRSIFLTSLPKELTQLQGHHTTSALLCAWRASGHHRAPLDECGPLRINHTHKPSHILQKGWMKGERDWKRASVCKRQLQRFII